VKVVSERLGHAHIAFTMQTYQQVLPDMQVDAARMTELLGRPIPPADIESGEARRNTRGKTA
jgi:integrase